MSNPTDSTRYTLFDVYELADKNGLRVTFEPDLVGTRGGPFTIYTETGRPFGASGRSWEPIASGHTLDEIAGCVQGIIWARNVCALRHSGRGYLGEDL